MKPFYTTTGYATNSSSSHSVLRLKDAFDKLFPKLMTHDDINRKNLEKLNGGEDFLIATKQEKRRYFLARVLEGLSHFRLLPNMVGSLTQRARLSSPTASAQERRTILESLGYKDDALEIRLALYAAGVREVPRTYPQDPIVQWGMLEHQKSATSLAVTTETFRGRIEPQIPRDLAMTFFRRILPQDDLAMNERILQMDGLFEKNPYFGDDLFLERWIVGFANDDYSWGLLDFNGMLLVSDEQVEDDLRFTFMREVCAYLERPDIVIIGGSDDSGTGWDGDSRYAGDEMCGDGEIEVVQHVATQGVERHTFGTLMCSFINGQTVPQWGIQPYHKRLLSPTMAPSERHGRIVKDPVYGHWTNTTISYRPYLGTLKVRPTRTRWTILDVEPPTRASAPDVVDLKITNKCPFACPYCYQASIPQGQHASTEGILSVLRALGDWGVFEAAIGGGEPTLHPDIHKILAYANAQGIIPSITTRNKKWITTPANVPWIMNAIGGVGYSVDSAEDVQDLYDTLKAFHNDDLLNALQEHYDTFILTLWELFDEWGIQHSLHKRVSNLKGWVNRQKARNASWEWDYVGSRIVIHVVCGVHPVEQVIATAKRAMSLGYDLLLLDFKQEGFAKGKTPHDYSTIPQFIYDVHHERDADGYPIMRRGTYSIDTPLAARFQKELVALGAAPQTFDVEDGRFSFYIDATTEQAGPSSYAPASEMRRYTPIGNDSLNDNLYGIFNSTPATGKHHTLTLQEHSDVLFG